MTFCFLIFSVLVVSVCMAEPVGIVLSGGGAKGAYQVGVWQALTEKQIADDVKVFSGTSIGAINSALFATVKDTGKCKKIWIDEVANVFKLNDSYVKDVAKRYGKYEEFCRNQSEYYLLEIKYQAKKEGVSTNDLSLSTIESVKSEAYRHACTYLSMSIGISGIGKELIRYLQNDAAEGVADTAKLREVIKSNIPKKWKKKCSTVYVTTLAQIKESEFEKREFLLNEEKRPDIRCEKLIASASIPFALKKTFIDGLNYVDGGWEAKGGDNVPIGPIIENHKEIKRIYVVYLNAENEIKRRIDKSKYSDKEIIEIIPSENMGGLISGTLNFDADRAKELIELGYKDAMKVLADAVYKSDDDKAE